MKRLKAWIVTCGLIALGSGCALRLEIEPFWHTWKMEVKEVEKEKPEHIDRKKAPFTIPRANLEIPRALKTRECADRLEKIYRALEKYEKDHGRRPDWLSDLVPAYLAKEDLYCPNDPAHQSPDWAFPDPNLPCSYCYELCPALTPAHWGPVGNMPMRENKTIQHTFFGDVLPIVRCFHHGMALNLSWDGKVYVSEVHFEKLFVPNYSHEMLFAGRK